MEIAELQKVSCEIEQNGIITTPAHVLHDIVRKLPENALIELESFEGKKLESVGSSKSPPTRDDLLSLIEWYGTDDHNNNQKRFGNWSFRHHKDKDDINLNRRIKPRQLLNHDDAGMW